MTQTFYCPSCGAPLDTSGGSGSTMRCPFCNSSIIIPESLRGSPSSQGGGDSDPVWSALLPQISRLVQQDQKIEAIKLYRTTYGVGLVEAKNAIDAIARGEIIQAPSFPQNVDVNSIAEIGRLMRANRKIDAIKLYRQVTGAGLKEAKDAVEALERGEALQISSTSTVFSTRMNPVMNANDAVGTERTRQGTRAGAVILSLIIFVMIALIGLGAVFFTVRTTGEVVDGVTQISNEILPAAATAQAQELVKNQATPTPSSASLLLSFGEKGMGPGQFQDARSIAVDPQGNLYLAEYQGGRVLVFDSAGKFKNEWNTGDKKAALLSLAVDRNGVVMAVMSGDVLRFKGQTGELINRSKYGGADKSAGFAVFTQEGGVLLIAGGENVWLFDAQGKQKLQILQAVSKVSDNSELSTHAAVDGQGNIYLLGHFNNAVFKYSTQGKFLNQFGSSGDNPGQFRAPEDIAVDGQGRVYVTDINGIQIFDSNGRYLSTVKVEGAAFGMTVDDQGNLYVITNKPKVYKFKVNVMP